MSNLSELVKTEIKRQYKSIYRFSEVTGIPYSTLSHAISKGFGGTAYETVLKICNTLNIRQVYSEDVLMINERFGYMLEKLARLDERGINTLEAVLQVEYNRCVAENNEPVLKNFSSSCFAKENINQLTIEKNKK